MAFRDTIKEENGKRYIYASTQGKPGDWYPERVYKNFVESLKLDVTSLDPTFGRYVDNLKTVITDGVKTMATGLGYLYVNPAFTAELIEIGNERGFGKNLAMFVILHEVFHNVYNHMDEGRLYASEFPSHTYRNMAMDYEINILIETLFPQFKGCTEAIPGLIKAGYLGQMWTEIYPDMKSDPMRLSFDDLENQLENQDNTKQDDEDDTHQESNGPDGDGSAPMPKDYLDGRNDAAVVLRELLGGILNGKNSTPDELQRALDEIRAYAGAKGLSINESNNPNDDASTWTEGYNDGFISKFGEVYADIYRKLHGIEPPAAKGNSGESVKDDDLRDLTGADAPKSNNPSQSSEDNNDENNDAQNGGNSSSQNSENGDEDGQDSSSNGGGSGQDGDEQQNSDGSSSNGGEGGEQSPTDGGDTGGDGEDDSNGGNSQGNDKQNGGEGSAASSQKNQNNSGGNPGTGSQKVRLGGDLAYDEEGIERLSDILDGQGKEEEESTDNTKEDIARDVKKIIDNQLEKNKSIDSNSRKRLEELSERMGEVIDRISNNSDIKWEDILERFVSRRVKVRTHKYDTAGRRFGDRKIIRHVGSRKKKEDGLKHIIFSIDTSGSVVAACLGFLMNEVCDILENHIDEGCIVDVIKHDCYVHSCIRFKHESDNLEKEIGQINVLEDTGGTDYKDVMTVINALLNGVDTGYPEFDDYEGSETKADCAIMLTDRDFYGAGKDYDIDVDKIRILIYGGSNRYLSGSDVMFADSIINVTNRMHESAVFEDTVSLDDFDYDENDTVQDVEIKQDEKDVFMKKNLCGVINKALRENGISDLDCVYEEGKIVLKGTPIIDDRFIEDVDVIKHVDLIQGDVKLFRLNDRTINNIPKNITGNIIMCNCNISDEVFSSVKKAFSNNKFYYTNCGGDTLTNAPSLNAAVIIDYYMRNSALQEKFVIKDIEGLTRDKRYKSLLNFVMVPTARENESVEALDKLLVSNLFVDNDIVDVFVTIEAVSGQRMISLNGSDFDIDEYPSNKNFPEFFKIRLSNSSLTLKDVNLNSIVSLPREMKRGTCVIIRVYGTNAKTRELATEYRKIHNEAKDLAKFLVSVA